MSAHGYNVSVGFLIIMTKFIRLTTNQDAAPIRRVVHSDGREYIIAPDIAIVEGVMNDLLYTGEEIAAYIDAWNGRPLVFDHPQDPEGNFISANKPDIFALSPGYFFDARFDGGKLMGDWWIDVAKAKSLGPQGERFLLGLEAGKMFEQSTGLFTDVDETPGEWQGVHYDGIARNIRPDHVAILLDEEGACSIADGCGAPRVNSEADEQSTVWQFLRPLANLLRKIDNNNEDANAGAVVSSEIDDEVIDNESEVNIMTREEMIQGLLALDTGFLTPAMLEAADDMALAALWAQFGEPAEPMAESSEVNEEEAASAAAVNLPPGITEVVDMIGRLGGVRAVEDSLRQSGEQARAQIDEMISAITANTDQFDRKELREMPITVLRKMVALTRSAATEPNMTGRGTGINLRPNAEDDEWGQYVPREVN